MAGPIAVAAAASGATDNRLAALLLPTPKPMMLNQICSWFGWTKRRASHNNARWRGRTEWLSLNDHLFTDIGCSQQSVERATEHSVRFCMLRLSRAHC